MGDPTAAGGAAGAGAPAPVVFGPFTLYRQLGRGGMGEVFIAHTPWPDAPLAALKRLREDIAEPSTNARFQHEAALALRMDHPHVVGTLGVGHVGGRLYVASELIEGRDAGRIADRLRERGEGAPAAVALRLLLDGLSGLAYVHQLTELDGQPLELVHRDLTPGNLLLSYTGDVKIADFGLAKSALSEAITATEQRLRIGTPAYMAPELATELAASPRSDIYGLGAVLYRFLTGIAPFTGGSAEVLRKLRRAAPTPLSDLRPDLPEWLCAFVATMMARRPSARPADAAQLRTQLLREAQAANLLVPRAEVGGWLSRLFATEYAAELAELARLRGQPAPAAMMARSHPQLLANPDSQPSRSSLDLEEAAMQRGHLRTGSWDVATIGFETLLEEATVPDLDPQLPALFGTPSPQAPTRAGAYPPRGPTEPRAAHRRPPRTPDLQLDTRRGGGDPSTPPPAVPTSAPVPAAPPRQAAFGPNPEPSATPQPPQPPGDPAAAPWPGSGPDAAHAPAGSAPRGPGDVPATSTASRSGPGAPPPGAPPLSPSGGPSPRGSRSGPTTAPLPVTPPLNPSAAPSPRTSRSGPTTAPLTGGPPPIAGADPSATPPAPAAHSGPVTAPLTGHPPQIHWIPGDAATPAGPGPADLPDRAPSRPPVRRPSSHPGATLQEMSYEVSEGAALLRVRGIDPASVPPAAEPWAQPLVPAKPPPTGRWLTPVRLLTLLLSTLLLGIALGFYLGLH